MKARFPRGEIHVRGWSADECIRQLRERFDAVRRGRYPLRHIQHGRLDGRVQRGSRFRLSYRLPHAVHSGALVLRARVTDAPHGCTIRYRTAVEPVTLAFWIIWTLALLGVIVLSLIAPEAGSAWRVGLVAAILLLVPVLIFLSLRRGKADVELALAELREWLGERVMETR